MEGGAYAEMYELEDRHWWFRGRRRLIRALLHHVELPEKVRLLDAGCGTGRNLVEFGGLGPSSGVDPSQEAVAYCRKRGLENVSCAGLEELPFEDGEFDLLLACDVIEHVVDDRLALSELFRVASDEATLIVTVPAYQWMWTEHDVQLHHLRRYTLRTVRDRAVEAGWRPVLATYFNSILLPAVAAARVVSKLSPREGHTDLDRTPGALNSAMEIPFRIEASLVRRGFRFPAGVSVAMVCRRDPKAAGAQGA
jgi:SAM-dependent methyltransferase